MTSVIEPLMPWGCLREKNGASGSLDRALLESYYCFEFGKRLFEKRFGAKILRGFFEIPRDKSYDNYDSFNYFLIYRLNAVRTSYA